MFALFTASISLVREAFGWIPYGEEKILDDISLGKDFLQ